MMETSVIQISVLMELVHLIVTSLPVTGAAPLEQSGHRQEPATTALREPPGEPTDVMNQEPFG